MSLRVSRRRRRHRDQTTRIFFADDENDDRCRREVVCGRLRHAEQVALLRSLHGTSTGVTKLVSIVDGFFLNSSLKMPPVWGGGRAPKQQQQQQGKKFPKRCPRKVLTGGKFNTSVHYFFVRDDECLEIETNNNNNNFLVSLSLFLTLF